jgi:DNA-binding NarL/FixJ family response regulator
VTALLQVVPPVAPEGSPRLRARDDVLARARRALRAGSGVAVVGPAASGRTRILDALAGMYAGGDIGHAPVRVDDAEHLSVDELASLASDSAPILAAVRAEGRVALEAVRARLRPLEMLIVVLEPLGSAAARAVIGDVLGGPVADDAVETLCAHAGGRPGDLVALTRGSIEAGALVHGPGGWQLVDRVATHRVSTDVEQRLGTRFEDAELVALGEPLPVGVVSAALGRRRHEALHREGTLGLVDADRVVLARPAEAAWLRERCPRDRRRRHLRALADAAGTGRIPLERVATWRMEAGCGEAGQLLEAAAGAHRRGAFGLAARFATEAMARGAGPDAALARGIVRANLQDPDGAGHDLRRGADVHTANVEVALAHARRTSDCGDAPTVSRPSPLVVAYRAVREATHGRTAVAREMLGALENELASTSAPISAGEVGRLGAAAAASVALVGLDREAIRTAHRLWSPAGSVGFDLLPLADDLVEAAAVELASMVSDDVVEPLRIAREQEASATREEHLPSRLAWSSALATARAERGDLDGADVALRVASRSAADLRLDEAGARLRVRRAWIAVQSGAAEHARRLLEAARRACREDDRVATTTTLVTASLGIVEADDVDVDEAATTVIAAGDAALDRGQIDAALAAYALAVRTDAVCVSLLERVRRLATRVAEPMTSLLTAHAEQLLRGDVDGLVEISDRYLATGRRLRAAEAAAQAARRADDPTLAARASGLAASCAGAWSPLLAELAPVELGPRVREIGRLVVGGWSNRKVADHLTISVRTVESSLTDLYRRLGVTGRQELARVHGPLLEPG